MGMRVGVLGGGLQGCCTALALADRGVEVTLFDRNQALVTRAGAANEGKIHLGYMYAGDPTLRTAKTMMTGALAFEPFLKRHLGAASPALETSMAAAYVIHRDAQQPPEQIAHYLNQVHDLIAESVRGRPSTYFGMELEPRPRRWSASERDAKLNSEIAVDVYQTAEVAINPQVVAEALRHCIAAHPLIETRLGCEIVDASEEPNRIRVRGRNCDGAVDERFDQVVNALWDGRLALNEAFGMPTGRAWIHRLKYGVSFRLPAGAEVPPSTTFVLGPFGEVVSYGEGLTYLTWYPICLRAISRDLTPPDWVNYPDEPLRSEVLTGTLQAMAEIVPALRALDPATLPEATVKGGVIVAWGATDIYDPESELHQRYEIGVTSKGRFHSVDPGKLTMAPYFAEQCADRVLNGAA
jgi:glycine/D-amino acid oxidase-like deaminating enzyme